jgi:hypothetical protein
VRGNDDDQFGLADLVGLVLEHATHQRNIAKQRHLAL